MWSYIEEKFRDKPSQRNVVNILVRHGIAVRNGKLYLGDIKISYSAIAKVANVDRRVVLATISTIMDDPKLNIFFQNLLPAGPFLRNVAEYLGYTCLTIIPKEDRPGILAAVSGIIARYNTNIIQVIAEDPHLYPIQKLHIIVEGELPGEAINEIKRLSFIRSIQIS